VRFKTHQRLFPTPNPKALAWEVGSWELKIAGITLSLGQSVGRDTL
jgi:hypothetical protein